MRLLFPVASGLALLIIGALLLGPCGDAPTVDETDVARAASSDSPVPPAAPLDLVDLDETSPVARGTIEEAEPAPLTHLEVSAWLTLEDELGPPDEQDGVWVLDPEVYDVKAFRAATRKLGTKRAWNLVEEFGTRVATPPLDKRGRLEVVIPMPGRRAEVHVRARGYAARRTVRHHEDGRLSLELDKRVIHAVTMTVVDQGGGVVADVPVQTLEADEPYMPGRYTWTAARRSDPSGKVTLVPKKQGLVVVPEVLGVRAESALEDGGEIRLPPQGALRIDFANRPVTGRLTLKVEAGRWNDKRTISLDGESHVRVERVATGKTLTLRGRLEEGSVEVELEGPVVNGEVVLVPVTPIPYRRITARLVDAAGVPVPEMRALLEIGSYGPVLGASVSDREGFIEFEFPESRNLADEGTSITLHAFRRSRERHRGPYARSKMPALTEDDRLPLGDLVLREQPLFFSGRVVTPNGAPVEGAAVRWGKSMKENLPMGGRFGIGGGADRNPRYRVLTFQRTDAEGRFDFRSVLDQNPEHYDFTATATKSGYEQKGPVTFEPGGSSVILVLEETSGD